jgi:hypothetical protein
MHDVFSEADFQPLADFPLSWRWLSPSHAPLTYEVLSDLRALKPSVAFHLADRAAELCGAHDAAAATFSATGDSEVVRELLERLAINPTEPVLLSWDRDTALLMTWHTFCGCWDVFCYPASDDITIWSPEGNWVLCYHHSECFRFRRGAVSNAARPTAD